MRNSTLYLGTLNYSFFDGYTYEKAIKELNLNVKNDYSSNKDGKDFYNNVFKYISLKIDNKEKKFTKEEFEIYFRKRIEKKIFLLLDIEVSSLENKINKLKHKKDVMKNINKHNLFLKRDYPYIETKYMNKYFVYNNKIFQVVRIKYLNDNLVNLIFDNDNKVFQKTITLEELKNRKFYITKNEIKE